ncbi:unnamed protein product [Protopolystoma xenopodis]|uniref:Uncharacterized protein n=1 Tax=Protopolystoma xenopodis TaxID=117903 RepID=A0A448XML3_9PLAT|nr:unnamed protein product [Protopolystoma xenopodis]
MWPPVRQGFIEMQASQLQVEHVNPSSTWHEVICGIGPSEIGLTQKISSTAFLFVTKLGSRLFVRSVALDAHEFAQNLQSLRYQASGLRLSEK